VTLPYHLRLVCLSFACFFAVNLAANLAVRWFSSRAIRRAVHMPARHAAQMLLALRLFPAGFALFCVIALCVPSYLWLEPDSAAEAAGFVALTAAALGALMWVYSLSQAVLAAVRSRRYLRDRLHIGREVALVGILRPRVIVSSEVASRLTASQLDVVLRHELAHRASRDNLKRLLMLLTPGCFFANLDRAWKRFSEWAADDWAVEGDPLRAVELAAALVAVARLSRGAAPPELASTLVCDEARLAERVNRLLQDRPSVSTTSPKLLPVAIGIAAGIALAAPLALPWVHRVLERLMD
jgi:Peptidase family M48